MGTKLSFVLIFFLTGSSNYATFNDSEQSLTSSHNYTSPQEHIIRKTCSSQKICNHSNLASEYQNLQTVNCMCDEQCHLYGDCCQESQLISQSQVHFNDFESHKIPDGNGYFYIKTKCNDTWHDKRFIKECAYSSINSIPQQSDIMTLHTPVTSSRTNVTYGNMYCALCNYEEFFDFWKLIAKTERYYISKSAVSDIMTSLTFDEKYKFWIAKIDDTIIPLKLYPVVTDQLLPRLRKCQPDVISTCDDSAKNMTESIKCLNGATSMIYAIDNDNKKLYRNRYCAICNNDSVIDTIDNFCNRREIELLETPYNEQKKSSALLTIKCGWYINTTNLNICKQIYKRAPYAREVKGNKCLALHFPTSIIIERYAYVIETDQIFFPYQFDLYKNKSIDICMKMLIRNYTSAVLATEELLLYYDVFVDSDKTLRILAIICSIISIISLTAHLTIFCLLPDLRNLTGKNVASLSTGLLFFHICFQLNFFTPHDYCVKMVILAYYFILTAFYWLLTISFDVWYNFRIAMKRFRSAATADVGKKFLFYSIFSWIFPGCITLILVNVRINIPDVTYFGVYEHKFTLVNYRICWFSGLKPLLLFILYSFIFIMCLNFVFYCSAAFSIYSAQSNHITSTAKNDFKIFVRLAFLMGVPWIIEFVANYFDNRILYMIFIFLFDSQGLLIFVTFSCKWKVLESLKKRFRSTGKNNNNNSAYGGSGKKITSSNVSYSMEIRKNSPRVELNRIQ